MKSTIKDEWLVGEGEHEGHRLIARVNRGAQQIVGDGQYFFRVGIAVPFTSPQHDGMPNEKELQSLARIEDMIYDYFNAKHIGVLCIILTTQGMREFITYSASDNVAQLIEHLSQTFPAYDFQYYVEQDKDWSVYQYWAV